jgi:hypothetical protein
VRENKNKREKLRENVSTNREQRIESIDSKRM